MENENYDIRQEASAIVINECKKWLLQIMEEEMDKICQERIEKGNFSCKGCPAYDQCTGEAMKKLNNGHLSILTRYTSG